MMKWTTLFSREETFTIAGLILASILLGVSLGVMLVGTPPIQSGDCAVGQISYSGTLTNGSYIIKAVKWEEGFEKIRAEIGFYDVNASNGNEPVVISQNLFDDPQHGQRVSSQLTTLGYNVSVEFFPTERSSSIIFFIMGLARYYGLEGFETHFGYVIDIWSYNTC